MLLLMTGAILLVLVATLAVLGCLMLVIIRLPLALKLLLVAPLLNNSLRLFALNFTDRVAFALAELLALFLIAVAPLIVSALALLAVATLLITILIVAVVLAGLIVVAHVVRLFTYIRIFFAEFFCILIRFIIIK